MCTIVAAVGQSAAYPAVIAANRDEHLDRPSRPPFEWDGPIKFVAPRDEKAGGTWLGVNAHGLFVGITNRFQVPVDPARGSRGHVVTKAMASPDAESLHQALAAMDPLEVNAFHLYYADATGAAGVTWSDGERLWQERLAPGIHAVTERSFGAAPTDRAKAIASNWPSTSPNGSPDVEGLQAMLRRHDDQDPLGATCIHLPQFNFGTRSSAVILLGWDLSRSRMYWAEGSPCRSAYLESSALSAVLRPVV